MEEDPIISREIMLLGFPEWVVSYLFAPFADEVGWLPVLLKWIAIAFVIAVADRLIGGLIESNIWLAVGGTGIIISFQMRGCD